MREIKFRAWFEPKKEMYSVEEISFTDEIALLINKESGIRCRLSLVELMQYIGFHDKNGKEIYEGDILDVGKFGEVVKWSVHDASFVLQDPKTHFNDFFSDFEVTALEVIGNIYETNLEELK